MVEKANARGDARFSASVEIQLQADVGFVCLAVNSGGSWHGRSGSAFLNRFEKPAHFSFGADGDADEAGTHVAASVTQEDALALDSCEKSRTCGTEISEKEISCAGKSDDADFLEFGCEPGAEAFYGAHVSAHSASARNGGFGGDERGEIDGEGRHGAAEKRDGVDLPEDRAEAKAGERGGF